MVLFFALLGIIFVVCHSSSTVLDVLVGMENKGYLDQDQASFLTEHYPADLDVMMPRYKISLELNRLLIDYLDTQMQAGRISAARRYYLSTLMQLRNNTAASAPQMMQRSWTISPISALYTGDGNVVLQGQYKGEETSYENFYFGVSGYASNGREYALLTDIAGLHIVDITAPSKPVSVQFIKMEIIVFWRDVETWKHSNGTTYAYVAAQGGGKLYVVDLSGLDINGTATYVERGRKDYGHTVTVQEGYLILNTASGSYEEISGCQIFDLKPNPWDPPLVGSYQGNDCHDSSIHRLQVDGEERLVLIAAGGGTGVWNMVDIESTLFSRNTTGPYVIGETSTEPFSDYAYAHSHALDTSRDLLYVFEESGVYDIAVWDISNPKTPIFLRTFSYPNKHVENALVHNGHIRGDYLLVAHYHGGLRVFDIAESPDNIKEVGHYDTLKTDGSSEWYEGAWNLYCGLPSKNVLVADTKNGLYIFDIRDVDDLIEFMLPDHLSDYLFSVSNSSNVSSNAQSNSLSNTSSNEHSNAPSHASTTPSNMPSSAPSNTSSNEPSNTPSRASAPPSNTPSKPPSNIPSIRPSSLSPIEIVSTVFCDDTKDTFFVPENNKREPCRWLQARPELIRKLCPVSTEARQICPETCGVCSDFCEDTLDRFIFRGIARDCVWLRGREFLFSTLCDSNNGIAVNVCPETCNTCDGNKLGVETTTTSLLPSIEPSFDSSELPSIEPTDKPSAMPSKFLSQTPPAYTSPLITERTSSFPSLKPSLGPSRLPSIEPFSLLPSIEPSFDFSELLSIEPTDKPSAMPSKFLSQTPSAYTSPLINERTSSFPSLKPSLGPSRLPSIEPSGSALPSENPSQNPSEYMPRMPFKSTSLLPSMKPSLDTYGFPSIEPSETLSILQSEHLSQHPSEYASRTRIESPSLLPSSIPSLSSKLPSRWP